MFVCKYAYQIKLNYIFLTALFTPQWSYSAYCVFVRHHQFSCGSLVTVHPLFLLLVSQHSFVNEDVIYMFNPVHNHAIPPARRCRPSPTHHTSLWHCVPSVSPQGVRVTHAVDSVPEGVGQSSPGSSQAAPPWLSTPPDTHLSHKHSLTGYTDAPDTRPQCALQHGTCALLCNSRKKELISLCSLINT